MLRILVIAATLLVTLVTVSSASAASHRCSVDGVTIHVTKWSCAKARPWIRTVKDSNAYGDITEGYRDNARFALWWGYALHQPRSKWVFMCDIRTDEVSCSSTHPSTRGVSIWWDNY